MTEQVQIVRLNARIHNQREELRHKQFVIDQQAREIAALQGSVVLPIQPEEGIGETDAHNRSDAQAGRSGSQGDASRRHTGAVECRGIGARRDDRTALRSGGEARRGVASDEATSHKDRGAKLGPSDNAFGDEPIPVEPCKCGYKWRAGALPEEVCCHGGGEYVVVCPRCKATGELKAAPAWAVETWNAMRAATTAPVQDDDAEIAKRLRAYRGGDTDWRKLMNEAAERLERIASRLSPTPETDQRNPIEEADGYRDSVPEDDADALSLARGEITWLREAIRRFEAATITVEQQAALTVRAPSEGHDTLSGAAIGDVAAERQRQIDVEGWTPKHDDGHNGGALAKAAACYATGFRETFFIVPDGRSIDDNVGRRVAAWPWHRDWWKPGNDRRRQLVIAGALIVAEIERLDRASVGRNPEGQDRGTGLGRNDEHAVGATSGETPNPSSTPETGLIEALDCWQTMIEAAIPIGGEWIAVRVAHSNDLHEALANTSPAQPDRLSDDGDVTE